MGNHGAVGVFSECRRFNCSSWSRCNGLSPVRRQAITLNNVDVLSIGHLGTNFSDLCPEILTF